METTLRYLCLLLVSAGVDIVPLWRRLSPPSGSAAASHLSTLKVTSKWKQSERNTCSNAPTHSHLHPPLSPLQLLVCILPSFPVFHGCTFRMEQIWKMINNIHVIGTLASDAIDLLSRAEDGPLHWTARWKSFCFLGGSDSSSSDLMRIDQTQLCGKDPLCMLWHGQCVLNNYLLCFSYNKKPA